MSAAVEKRRRAATAKGRRRAPWVGALRMHAIRSRPGRWANATIAAALTYPAGFRETVEDWVELLDHLEDGAKERERT